MKPLKPQDVPLQYSWNGGHEIKRDEIATATKSFTGPVTKCPSGITIQAKRDGVCTTCHQPILKGASVFWSPEHQSVQHVECMKGTK